MSHTYRLTYTLGNSLVSKVLYVTTTDPQLGYVIAQLEGVRIDPEAPMRETHPLTGTGPATPEETAERKAGQR